MGLHLQSQQANLRTIAVSHTQAVPFLFYQSCQSSCCLPCMSCLLAHFLDQQEPTQRALAFHFQAKNNMLTGLLEDLAALISASDASTHHLVFRRRIFAPLQQCIPSQGYKGYFCFLLTGVLRHRNLRAKSRHLVKLCRRTRLYSLVAQVPYMNDSSPCIS